MLQTIMKLCAAWSTRMIYGSTKKEFLKEIRKFIAIYNIKIVEPLQFDH